MDPRDRDAALGLLVLSSFLLLRLLLPARPSPTPEFPDRPADAVAAAAFGFPLDASNPDPAAWRELPGVGPRLAQALALAASEGLLRGPDDLLRVPGIGIKMAADLAPRIRWTDPGSPSGAPAP